MNLRAWPLLAFLVSCGAPEVTAVAPPPPPPPPPTSAPAAAPALPPWASQYPATRAGDTKDVLFGTEVRDPYRWLEDAKSPEVQSWVKAEDDLTRKKLAALPDREGILARLKDFAYVETAHPPIQRGTRFFYGRRSGTQEKTVLYWREGKKGPEKVLLDPNTWSKDGSSSLRDWSVSWDGKRVAYTVSENNADEATMHVADVATGQVSKVDVIPGARYATAAWTGKGNGFYYTRLPVDASIPADQRPGYAEVRYHALGADPAKDELVHEKTGDPTTFSGTATSKDGRWLFYFVSHGPRALDVFFRDLTRPAQEKTWTPLAVGRDAQFDVNDYKGKFYVRTNENAPHWSIFEVDPAHIERTAWKEIVPQRSDANLLEFEIVGGKLVLHYVKDVQSHLEIHDLSGKLVREVALPAIGTVTLAAERAPGPDPDQDDFYYPFETFNYPPEIHETSIGKGGDSVWFKTKVPVDPSAFVVEQLFAPSKDGTKVPLFIVHGKTTPRDGTAPTYLTGYGGFSVSELPVFNKGIFPWLERGGVYVLANLRGGGEYGEEWHRAGMKHQKQNVFDDFIAAAEFLIQQKVTSPEHLAIVGGSNGGLLVGAALTQRPELFRAVVCAVPLLDMVRYHLFGSGRTWIEEFGTAEKEDDFRALYAYSPYHHVQPGTPYPSVLLDSADSDDRVDPLHARKMAALLQADSTGGPVLLRIERNSGHGGADLVRAWVDRTADRYAFLLAEMKKQGSSMSSP
jgi:prolyl oligopeptidase